MLGLAAVPGALVVLLLLRLPDTARWYMMRGPHATRPGGCSPSSTRTPTSTPSWPRSRAALSEERGGGAAAEMLRKPFLRATVFVVGLGFFIQITGINAIVYYSPRIFEAMGFTGNAALLGLPALVQVAGLAAVFVSLVTGRPASAAGPSCSPASGSWSRPTRC